MPAVIVIDKPEDPKEVINLLHSLQAGLSYEVIKTVHYKTITLKCCTMEDYDIVLSRVKDAKEGWHTWTARSRRQVRMVMANAPAFYSDQEYTNALINHGLEVPLLYRMKNKSGAYTNSLMVGFAHGTSLAAINKATKIMDIHVRWRPFVPSKGRVTLCKRCSAPGHAAHNCGRRFQCPTCKEDHPSDANCPRKEEAPLCRNCGQEGHAATSARCPKISKIIEERKKVFSEGTTSRARTSSTASNQGQRRRNSTAAPRASVSTSEPAANPKETSGPKAGPSQASVTFETDGAPKFSWNSRRRRKSSSTGPTPEESNKDNEDTGHSTAFRGGLQALLEMIRNKPEVLHDSISPVQYMALLTELVASVHGATRLRQLQLVSDFSIRVFCGSP